MPHLNKVILIGHLTADPELKQSTSGISVTSFKIGVARNYKTGEQQQTDFINIVAWRGTADFITKYFKKGNAICICGSLQTRSWTANDGSKRYATEVIADEASFAGSKSDADVPTESKPTPSVTKSEFDKPFVTTQDALAKPKTETVQTQMVEISTDEDLPF